MARPLISHERWFEAPFEPAGSYTPYELASPSANGLHARGLQRRLADAFAPENPSDEIFWNPSPAQRLGIVIGSSALLWIMIGTGVFVLSG